MPLDASRGDAARLLDMLEASRIVLRHTEGKSRDDYERDQLLRDAVERRIEIVGEAARFVSDTFKAAQPEIPWHKIMATRHILAHEYGDVDNDIMWQVVTVYLPQLIALLEPLVPMPPPDE